MKTLKSIGIALIISIVCTFISAGIKVYTGKDITGPLMFMGGCLYGMIKV